MKILLVAPRYHNYYKEISEVLKKQGHCVVYFPDDQSGLLATLATRFRFVNTQSRAKDFKKFKEHLSKGGFEAIIVIRGERFKDESWRVVLKEFVGKKILYQWDSVQNFNYLEISPLFDSVLTFDRMDAKLYGFEYLPLFYKETGGMKFDESIDLLFVGVWHSDRVELLTEIYKKAKNAGLNCYFRVYYPYYLYLYLLYVKGLKIKTPFFIHKPIPLAEMQRLYRSSKCVVDIASPGQTGLTMRTIETLGNRKKLLTTNESIRKELFYDESQVAIIERENLDIDLTFLNDKHEENMAIKQYEINNWVKLLLYG